MRVKTVRRLAAVLFFTLLSAGACGQSSSQNPPASSSAGAAPVITRNGKLLDGLVDVKLLAPTTGARMPAVISLVGNAPAMVAAGFVAVTYKINWTLIPDRTPPPSQSEHPVGSWVLLSPSAAVLGERYLRDISTAASLVPAVVDWVAQQPEVDPSRIGMAGGSTNGFVTLQVAAADKRLRAVVAIAACGDYRRFLAGSSMGITGKPLALDRAYDGWIETVDIVSRADRLLPTAVLMVNRTGDEAIPIACADETARVLDATYARAGLSDRFRFVRIEQNGHGIGAPEQAETMSWFTTWLKP